MAGRLSSGSDEVSHPWALDGYGISPEADRDVVDDLAWGRLVEILSGQSIGVGSVMARERRIRSSCRGRSRNRSST